MRGIGSRTRGYSAIAGVVACVAVAVPAAVPATAGSAHAAQHTGRVWISVSLGFAHSCGVQFDGSLWCWGDNGDGQVGVGDRDHHRRPTRV